MIHLFLPGNSISNKEWIDNLSNEFDLPKEVIHYNHWNTEGEISFDIELQKLKELPNEEYIVIAKSIGSILALKAIEEEILDIKKCFFIGFPYFYIKQNDINLKKLLDNDIDTTFIQKLHDPQIGYEELTELIKNIRPQSRVILYKREEEVNDNHRYCGTKFLKKLAS